MPTATNAKAAASPAASTSALPVVETPVPPLDSFPPTGTPVHAKAAGFAFWRDVLGSPRRVVAPMVDASELPWRILSRRHGAQLVYSPMISARQWSTPGKGKARGRYCDALFNRPLGEEGARSLDVAGAQETDRPLLVQFAANDPDVLLAAARGVEDHCDGVDLNLGCPQHIAQRGHFGSYLQEDWPLIFSLINKLHLNLKVPVTAKMRVFPDTERTVAYARMLERAGAQVIAVHGRTREMKGHRTGLADWRKIRAVKEAVSVPVIANGNVLYPADVDEALRITGADAVMSAEGNLYTPTIFGESPAAPSQLYPMAPELPFPDIIVLAREYLDIVAALKTPTAMSAVRSHMFKICRPAFEVHRDLRKDLGQARIEQAQSSDPVAIAAAFRPFVDLLAEQLEEDKKDPQYQQAPASRPPNSVPLRPDGSDVLAEGADPQRPSYIPHWLAQPYFRAPMPPEGPEADTPEAQAARQARAERVLQTHTPQVRKRSESPAREAPVEINDKQAQDEQRMAAAMAAPAGKATEPEAPGEDEPLAKKLRFALAAAAPVKAAANAHFTAGRFDEAVGSYNDALAILPPRPVPEESDDGEGSDAGEHQANVPVPEPVPQTRRGTSQAEPSRFVELADHEDPEESLLLLECVKARAVLYSNMAACHLKLEDYKGAVAAASNSLADDPDYIKSLNRRAQANEALGGWSALSAALDDYKHLSRLPDTPASLRPTIRSKLVQLPPRVEAAATREKDEMMGKLKGIGDSVLGWFGLSTDNFQIQQQPGGGSSINFVPGKGAAKR